MMRFFKSLLFPASQKDLNNSSHVITGQNQRHASVLTRQESKRQSQVDTPQTPILVPIRVVIIGDKGSGKSSLIVALWPNIQNYNQNPSSFPFTSYLFNPPPTFADRDPLIITEMPSRFEEDGPVADEIRRSDVVLLTYACSEETQISRLDAFWLPYLNWLQVKVPIILVGSKTDVVDEAKKNELDKHLGYLMNKCWNINYGVRCCTSSCSTVLQVFNHTQKSVLFPLSPLFDLELQDLNPEFVIVLKKIFAICDQDCDGCLDGDEFHNFKVAFFMFLDPEARATIDNFKEALEQRGVTLTLKNFVQLFLRLVQDGDYRTVWMVVKAYGFKDELMGDCSKMQPSPSRSSSDISSSAAAVVEVNGCIPKWSKPKRS